MKVTLAILFGFLTLLAVVGLFLPRQYSVTQKITIASTPAAVFAQVHDLRNWTNWMPWSEQSQGLSITQGAITQGVGATQRWVAKDGAGSLEVVASKADEFLEYELRFGAEDTAESREQARARIEMHPLSTGTEVVWSMQGRINTPVVGGYFALYMNRLAGVMFRQGLRNLKAVVEADATKTSYFMPEMIASYPASGSRA